MLPYAEVIGDPIAQSKSPAIHGFWLKTLGIAGEYRATRIAPIDATGYFEARRQDRVWCGCNVTAPNKSVVIPFLDHIDPAAERIGAVNCIYPKNGALTGLNTDIDGIAEALGNARIEGGKVVLIGAGGVARATLTYLAGRRVGSIVVLARDTEKAAAIADLGGGTATVAPLASAEQAIAGAAAVINASVLGMVGADQMPDYLLRTLESALPGAVAFDMVTAPTRTRFLQSAEAARLRPVDGLVMLIGQARRAFELFFGAAPPRERDDQLRHLLLGI